MTNEKEELKKAAFDARTAYRIGAIDRKTAKEEIMPYIKAFNEKSKEIAAKYGMRAKKISFAAFVR